MVMVQRGGSSENYKFAAIRAIVERISTYCWPVAVGDSAQVATLRHRRTESP